MKRLVEIRNLSVTYPQSVSAALNGVSLDLNRAEILCVIGESGSGKTTLARALGGLLPLGTRCTGEISFPGLDAKPVSGRDIGFVFQEPLASFDPLMSIGGQIVEVLRCHTSLSPRQAMQQAENLLRRVHIDHPEQAIHRYPHQFSGGQLQRIAIAIAIAAGPALLIADEATSALDTLVQREIIALLRQLVAEDGMSLLFVTHDIALVSGFADHIAVMQNSRVVEVGQAAQIIHSPSNPYTQRLIDICRMSGEWG